MKCFAFLIAACLVALTVAEWEVEDRGWIPIVCGICKKKVEAANLEELKKLPKEEFQKVIDEKVCGTVPQVFRADCSKFLVKNIDNIYSTAQNGGGPKETCVAIGVC